ncbi:MAG: hypothetical protein PHW72_01305 [Candidatus Pacebacteria bacterium]|nr:hypothetical protein [Candidatus Paceibacterota bacterium]
MIASTSECSINYGEVWRKGVPFIQDCVINGSPRLTIFIPEGEYVFSFSETAKRLDFGRGSENVIDPFGCRRGEIQAPYPMKRRAFNRAYATWKRWTELKKIAEAKTVAALKAPVKRSYAPEAQPWWMKY